MRGEQFLESLALRIYLTALIQVKANIPLDSFGYCFINFLFFYGCRIITIKAPLKPKSLSLVDSRQSFRYRYFHIHPYNTYEFRCRM